MSHRHWYDSLSLERKRFIKQNSDSCYFIRTCDKLQWSKLYLSSYSVRTSWKKLSNASSIKSILRESYGSPQPCTTCPYHYSIICMIHNRVWGPTCLIYEQYQIYRWYQNSESYNEQNVTTWKTRQRNKNDNYSKYRIIRCKSLKLGSTLRKHSPRQNKSIEIDCVIFRQMECSKKYIYKFKMRNPTFSIKFNLRSNRRENQGTQIK